ncbi:ARM repeat superfamily protein, putative isoform 3, partial [Capsicum annuum]
MTATIPGQLLLKPPNYVLKGVLQTPVGVKTRKANNFCTPSNLFFSNHGYGVNPRLCSGITRACNDGGGQQSSPADVDLLKDSSSNTADGYIALFVRMLGLDHDPLDREQAVIALWKYSLGGKQCLDMIMQFRGSVNLTVNLLKSESDAACEAAAGLLRMISSVNMYRDLVAVSGAIEEINGILRRSSLSPNVKEQSLSMLWNLSVDEKLRNKIANSDLLPLLIKFLEDEEVRVKEAAG